MEHVLETFAGGNAAQIAVAILAFGFMGLLGIVLRNFDSTIKAQNAATADLTGAVNALQLMIAKEYVTMPMHKELRVYCEGQFGEIYEKVSNTRERLSKIEGARA